MRNATQTLKFGIEHTDSMPGRLFVDLPFDMYKEVFEMPAFLSFKRLLMDTDFNALHVNKFTNAYRLTVKESTVRQRPDKADALQAITKMVTGLSIVAGRKGLGDPTLDIKMSSRFNVEGNLPTNFVLGLRDGRFIKDTDIADFGSTAMIGSAIRIGYLPEHNIVNEPFASVHRKEAYIGLHINPRERHEVESVRRSPVGRHIYALTESRLATHEEQYISIVGAVAIARAGELIDSK